MEQQILIDVLCKTITDMVKIFTPAIVLTNVTVPILERAKLKHISKAEGNIVSTNVPTPQEPIEEKELSDKTKKFIRPFIEKLVQNTNDKNLETLKRNLKTITIKHLSPLMLLYYSGAYDVKNNKIEIITKKSFGHELLHLASSYYDDNTKISYTGFRQSKNGVFIGDGLNEGYTELLASRLYNKQNKIRAYKKGVKIARLFEFFFDDPKEMESYYFNHNLPGFIHHLEKFAPRKEILKLIHEIDNIKTYSSAWLSPLPTINYIKAQVNLYNMFERSNPNPEKLQEFKDLIFETPMAAMIISRQEFKLNHSAKKLNNEKNQNKKH